MVITATGSAGVPASVRLTVTRRDLISPNTVWVNGIRLNEPATPEEDRDAVNKTR